MGGALTSVEGAMVVVGRVVVIGSAIVVRFWSTVSIKHNIQTGMDRYSPS